MTTPHSLTEEQIATLALLPVETQDDELIERVTRLPFELAEMYGRVDPDDYFRASRKPAADLLLATLQAERERERERVNQLVEIIYDNRGGFMASFTDMGDSVLSILGDKFAQGDTFIDALKSAANPLSPDVLGDQKDKGKAALTAPERDKPVEVSEPSAADGLPMGPNELCRALVYVAGPYTNPDPVVNTRNAVAVGLEVYRKTGHAVIIPHLTLIAHMVEPHDVDFWYEFDLAQVRHCGALIRIPGDRSGADREVEFAKSLGIPVFHSVDEFGQALAFG